MKLLNFALIKITLCLIAGIVFAYYFELQIKVTLVAVSILLIGLSGFLIFEKGRWVKSNGFGILALFTFFVIGTLTHQLHDQKLFKTHYTQHIDPAKDSIATITFRIREVLKPGAFHNKYMVDILNINNQSLSGKTLLNVQKDSLSSPFNVDDVFLA
jgi:competence protein ComEC